MTLDIHTLFETGGNTFCCTGLSATLIIVQKPCRDASWSVPALLVLPVPGSTSQSEPERLLTRQLYDLVMDVQAACSQTRL